MEGVPRCEALLAGDPRADRLAIRLLVGLDLVTRQRRPRLVAPGRVTDDRRGGPSPDDDLVVAHLVVRILVVGSLYHGCVLPL